MIFIGHRSQRTRAAASRNCVSQYCGARLLKSQRTGFGRPDAYAAIRSPSFLHSLPESATPIVSQDRLLAACRTPETKRGSDLAAVPATPGLACAKGLGLLAENLGRQGDELGTEETDCARMLLPVREHAPRWAALPATHPADPLSPMPARIAERGLFRPVLHERHAIAHPERPKPISALDPRPRKPRLLDLYPVRGLSPAPAACGSPVAPPRLAGHPWAPGK